MPNEPEQEGQLYKQIHLEAEKTGFEQEGDMVEEIDEIVKQVLDDAKKEWLLIEDFRYNKGYVSQEEARQDWFKRWFGENNP